MAGPDASIFALSTVQWFGLQGICVDFEASSDRVIAAYLVAHKDKIFFAVSFGRDSPERRKNDDIVYSNFVTNRETGPNWAHRSMFVKVGRSPDTPDMNDETYEDAFVSRFQMSPEEWEKRYGQSEE